jgi:hypothetical protein
MISKGKKGQKQAIYQESYNLMGVPMYFLCNKSFEISALDWTPGALPSPCISF